MEHETKKAVQTIVWAIVPVLLMIVFMGLVAVTQAFGDSPIGSTIQGGYKACNFRASTDTLYTPENMTAYFTTGDPIKIWSPANGADPINGVISAENAAYMVLADTLSFLIDDTEAYFEHANRITVNDADGKTLSWVDASTGDTYVLDSSGNTIMQYDVSARQPVMYMMRLEMQSADIDTTGFVGGEVWAVNDSIRVYKQDHTIADIFP